MTWLAFGYYILVGIALVTIVLPLDPGAKRAKNKVQRLSPLAWELTILFAILFWPILVLDLLRRGSRRVKMAFWEFKVHWNLRKFRSPFQGYEKCVCGGLYEPSIDARGCHVTCMKCALTIDIPGGWKVERVESKR
jgi:hypothetical protein